MRDLIETFSADMHKAADAARKAIDEAVAAFSAEVGRTVDRLYAAMDDRIKGFAGEEAPKLPNVADGPNVLGPENSGAETAIAKAIGVTDDASAPEDGIGRMVEITGRNG